MYRSCVECLTGMSLWSFGYGGALFHGRLVRNGWKVWRGSTARANTSTTGVASINVYVMLTNFDYGSFVPLNTRILGKADFVRVCPLFHMFYCLGRLIALSSMRHRDPILTP